MAESDIRTSYFWMDRTVLLGVGVRPPAVFEHFPIRSEPRVS